MKCEHDIVDKDVACNCDGMCPLCLAVENKQLRQKIKEIGEKYSKATEYYDEFIAGDFVELPPTAKKFVNQIGDEILQIL